jgi:phosphoribosylformylglycinamidine (FGAM) synthase-like enzyme
VTSRAPLKGELDLLMADFAFYKNDFTKHPDGATKLLAVGEKPRNAKLNPAELAAYALVANTLLNLDEAIMQN